MPKLFYRCIIVVVFIIKSPIHRIETNIKRGIKYVTVDWLHLAQNWSYCGHTLNNMPSYLEYEELLHPLYNCQFRNRKSFFRI
jgi:hypothetical protein